MDFDFDLLLLILMMVSKNPQTTFDLVGSK